MEQQTLTHYPLLFTFDDPVFGRGFLAKVTARGRALAVREEDEGWWLYGVNPGGLAAGSQTFTEAHAEFRKSYREVLFDIAQEAETFAHFREQVAAFFGEVNRPTETEWTGAVQEVRAGRITLEGLPGITRQEKAETPTTIEVVELQRERFTPADNAPDEMLAAAA